LLAPGQQNIIIRRVDEAATRMRANEECKKLCGPRHKLWPEPERQDKARAATRAQISLGASSQCLQLGLCGLSRRRVLGPVPTRCRHPE
jgi:hypothetical protein